MRKFLLLLLVCFSVACTSWEDKDVVCVENNYHKAAWVQHSMIFTGKIYMPTTVYHSERWWCEACQTKPSEGEEERKCTTFSGNAPLGACYVYAEEKDSWLPKEK